MKQFIKFLSIMVIAFLFLTTGTALAEKVTFVKEYNYNASDLDSKVSSRTIALEQVKRLLLEELGTYLISETEVKNFRLTKDQVTTYSAGVVSAEVIDEKWDGKTYYLKAKVAADPAEVAKSLQNIVNDKQKSKELEDVRKKASEFSREIERLKKELEIAKTNTTKPAQKADAKKVEQYNEAVKGLSATDWLERGDVFFRNKQYKEAMQASTKAIELSPMLTDAYFLRGLINTLLKNHQSAINDFSRVIEETPEDSAAYDLRGNSYFGIEDYQSAFADFNKAIELNPKNAGAYYGRGGVYLILDSYQKAIVDFSTAIEIDPTLGIAYMKRGLAYGQLGKKQQAVDDFKRAARLGDKPTQDYLKSSGIEW